MELVEAMVLLPFALCACLHSTGWKKEAEVVGRGSGGTVANHFFNLARAAVACGFAN